MPITSYLVAATSIRLCLDGGLTLHGYYFCRSNRHLSSHALDDLASVLSMRRSNPRCHPLPCPIG